MSVTNSPNTYAETITVLESQTLFMVNMTNVTKLNASNFLMWSLQVYALLDGYGFGGYLDGSTTAPESLITTNGVVSPNAAYTLWKRHDRLIYSVLLGAVTTTLKPLWSKTTTVAEIWSTLSSIYVKPSRGHVKQLKQQFKQWTKGTKSINEYVQGFTTRFDQLALLEKAIDHEDQLEYILEGLSEDYKSVIDQIEARDSPPLLTEL